MKGPPVPSALFSLFPPFSLVPVSQVLGSPDLDPVFQMCLRRAGKKERITSLNLLGMFCLLYPRILMIIFGMRVHFCLTVSLVSPRTSRFFLQSWLLVRQPSDCAASWDYPPHGKGLCIFLCWVSGGSCQFISLAFRGLSGWQCNPLVYQ